MKSRVFLLALWLPLFICVHGLAADVPQLDSAFFDKFPARPLGPANMGGRVTDLAAVDSKPSTYFVATATGGLWKTVNNGTTWKPLFDQQATISLGAVAVSPSNPNIVWVGTGEANARNSASWGDGVYKSTDGGKTWANMGLRDSHHVGRIVIHPKDSNIVYVAALGHIWGANKERGLYKTSDGGKHWEAAMLIDDETGFIDLVMDPSDPDTLYAAAFRVRRGPFSGGNPAVMFAWQSGIYKTTDAGKSWTKLSKGLPERPLGRIGLTVHRKDPRILYAVVPTDKTDIRQVAGQSQKRGSNAEIGGIFRSDDKGATWTKLNDLCPRPFYFGQIRVDPNDDNNVYVCGVPFWASRDGGKTFRTMGGGAVHADQHALWIDPHDSDHLIVGCDGGVYTTYDRCVTWEHIMNLPLAQFYGVAADMRRPYRVYGGLQDNGSWGGPSATRFTEGVTVADWFKILGADGFYCQVDPTEAMTVYAEGQYGRLHRLELRTNQDKTITPAPAKGQPAYRFNWSAPILLSWHDPRTVYYGGNYVFRSTDRGDNWTIVSPDMTRGQPGPSDVFGHTITTIAESPLRPGILWVGTDDGKIHVNRDGNHWTDLSNSLPNIPGERWITRFEASAFEEGSAFLAIDRHRQDDRRPLLFKTTDFGYSWRPINGNLPAEGYVHVLRQSTRNRNVLFAGTEFGLFLSLDAGQNWHRLRLGQEEKPGDRLLTCPVHDLLIHPRERDLIIATHGRGMFVMDIAPLEELTPEVQKEPVHLFDMKAPTLLEYRRNRGLGAGKLYAAPNPLTATITYHLKDDSAEPVHITIHNAQGKQLEDLTGSQKKGLQRVTWGLTGVKEPGEFVAKLRVGSVVVGKKFQVYGED
jgi:photosystem II stability/assembly factor-like uncharacterized protein